MAKKPKIGCIVSSAAFLAFLVTVFYEFLSHHNVEHKLGAVKGGFLSLFLFAVFVAASDFTYRITSDHYSFRNLWLHYFTLLFLRLMSMVFYRKLEKSSKNVEKTQTNLLMKYIEASRGTEYGKDHHFDEIRTVSDFLSRHPLTTYSHYKSYIDRIAAGELNVMNKKQPYVLAMTSGTSGQPKMMPTDKRQRTVFFTSGVLPLFKVLCDQFDGTVNLQKKLKFFYAPKHRESASGILIGPNSSSPANSPDLPFHSTPGAAFRITSEPDALYVYLLFGLKDKKLGYLEANFASLIYTAFVSLERNWRSLVSDIRNGQINSELLLDSDIRNELEGLLTPDPERAAELETEFERGFLGICKEIWPHMNFILCVDSGSFQVYGELLKNGYCKGIHIYSPIYAATEGLIGLNLHPHSDEKHYMLLPSALFYEFIPIEQSTDDKPDTVLLHQVEKNKEYEMVITNISGFYRYRFGDVVRIAGYHNSAPLVEFMYRTGQLLNVRGEKTSEQHFYTSLHAALKTVIGNKTSMVDYCCVERPATTDCDPHYDVYMEMSDSSAVTEILLRQLEHQIDEELCTSYVYKSFRVKNSIGPVQLSLVSTATFSQLIQSLIQENRATPNQFKVPRVLKNPDTIKFITSCVLLQTTNELNPADM